MNFIVFLTILLTLFSLVYADQQITSRAKRFVTGFGTLSTVGGHVGCVVSDNKLYINGRYTKELSDSEITELNEYKTQQDNFREAVKGYIEEQQKLASQGTISNNETKKQLKKPEPPKKPSFCSDKATTQYIFDGCSVQGDSIYIGDNFVRKLTPDEQEKLEAFDREFTTYQKAVTGQVRKQVEDLFGKHFGGLFGDGVSSKSLESNQQQEGAVAKQGEKLPEAPKTPQFCTLVV